MANGKVISFSDDSNNYTNLGKFVIIEHFVKDSVNKPHYFYTLYSMLSKVTLNKTGNIKAGESIGEIGPSGPLSKITNDDILVAAFTLRKDSLIELKLNSKSELLHNVYWYDITDLLEKSKKK
jgi:hypothetical protein